MRDAGSLVGLTGVPLLLVIVAVLALGDDAPQQQRGTSPPAPTEAAAPTPKRAGFDAGRRLVAEILGRDPTADDAVEAIVALMPDPDASTLDWVYDANLAGMRRALEKAGYLIDRSWMPSFRDTVEVSDGGLPVRGPASSLLPGIITFRDGEGGVMVVFVVGEVPTAGVHRRALHVAIEEATSLAGRGPGDTLRVLGPTFSGSAASLVSVLDSAARAQPCRPIRVMTGSATSSAARASLSFPFPSECFGSEPGGPVRHRVRFGATLHTDHDYAAVLSREVLAPLGFEPGQVALLSESSTAYGRTLSGDRLPSQTDGEVPDSAIIDEAIRLTFPLNIASVRSAYARNPVAEETPQRQAGPTSRLPLSLEVEPGQLAGQVARSRLTAPALDLALRDIVTTLRSQQIRAVGILASDVRDKLFLAEVVRRELPDVFLFTFEGNALYARRDLVSSLRGMVVASSYPLILQNVVWTQGEGYVPFSSEGAAGVFNATLHLIGRPEEVQEYRPPDARTVLARPPVWLTTVGSGMLLPLDAVDVPGNGQMPGAAARVTTKQSRRAPSLLEGVAAALGLLLVLAALVVPVRQGGGAPAGTGGAGGSDTDSSSGAAGAGALGHRLRAWRTRRVRLLSLADERRVTPTTGFPDGIEHSWRSLNWLASMAALLAFFAPLALLSGVGGPWTLGSPWLTAVGVILALELAAVVLMIAVDVVRHTRDLLGTEGLWKSKQVHGRIIPTLTDTVAYHVALALGGLGLWYCWQILTVVAGDGVAYGLYRFQTLRLDSGTSALVLILVASLATILLILWHRDRRHLLWFEHRQDLEPLAQGFVDTPGSPEQLVRLGRAATGIRARLEVRLPLAHLGVIMVACAAVIVSVAPFLPRLSLATLHDVTLGAPSAPTLMLWVGLACGLLGVVVAVVHLLTVWQTFKDFLRALADTPLAPAFDRLPDRLRTMGRLHLFDPTSDRVGHVLAESGHEAVWKVASTLDDDVLKPLGTSLAEARELAEALPGKDTPELRVKSLGTLIAMLREAWKDEPGTVWESGYPPPQERGGRRESDGDATKNAYRRWVRQAEDLLAVEGARYVDWVLRNIRRIAVLLLFLMLFTTVLLEVIPFPFHTAMTTIFIVLMVVGVVSVLAMMLQLARDDILSRITNTAPGQVNWSGASLLNALIFVALPVLSILGTEVAPVGRNIFGWLQGLLRLLSAG